MASKSNDLQSLRPAKEAQGSESWKDAPSREVTHDRPDGKDQIVEAARKPAENAPGTEPEGDDGLLAEDDDSAQ